MGGIRSEMAFQKRVWLKPCDISDKLSFPIVLFMVCDWVKAQKTFLVKDRGAEMGFDQDYDSPPALPARARMRQW